MPIKKAVRLTVSLYDTEEHPQRLLKRLGIKYAIAVPQTIADCWQFYLCEYDPDTIPDHIYIENGIDPHKRIGYGLSPEDAAKISAWMSESGFEITEQ